MATLISSPSLLVANGWRDYRLLDAGEGLRYERWGDVTLVRPDPQILWPRRSRQEWRDVDAWYHRSDKGGGRWDFRRGLPEQWDIRYQHLTFRVRPTNFKHTGLFPEQAVNWDWSARQIAAARATGREVQLLNLFGYTGAASVAAAAAGAQVCHVDAAKGMVDWCARNADASGLDDNSIRFIVDDCLGFVRRELRRGRRYDALILDPPSYGRGPSGEVWKLETHLFGLLEECVRLLSHQPLFLLVNAYTTGLSPTVLGNLLDGLLAGHSGQITTGEVGLPIEVDGRVLPCGIYGRWEMPQPVYPTMPKP